MKLHDEAGVSLVELLVAMTILAIVMTGVAATLASSLGTVNESQSATIASGLATSSLEAALTQSFSALEAEVTTPETPASETVNGREFTVTRNVSWVPSSAITGACIGTAAGGDTNVLLVDVQVSWTGARLADIASQQTTVSPPVGRYDPNDGTLAVYVSDASEPSQPVQGVIVTVTGPTGGSPVVTETLTTDADGCAVFDELDPGNYDVSLDKTSYVDIDQRVNPDVVETVSVLAGARASTEFRYAPAEFVDVTVVGVAGGAIPAGGLPLTAVNNLDAWPTADVPSTGTVTAPLWPDSYQFYAGTCPRNDPEGLDDSEPPVAFWDGATRPDYVDTSPGSTSVTIPAGTLAATWDADWPTGVSLTAVAESTDDCAEGVSSIDLGSVESTVDFTNVLPWGSWRIDVYDSGGVLVGSADEVELDPRVGGSVTAVIELDDAACIPKQATVVGTGDEVSARGARTLQLASGTQAGDVIFVVAYGVDSRSYMASSGYVLARVTERNDVPEATVWVKVATASDTAVSLDPDGEHYVAHTFTLRDVDTDRPWNPYRETEWKTNGDGRRYGYFGGLDVNRSGSALVLITAGRDGEGSALASASLDPSLGAAVHETNRGGQLLVTSWVGSVEPPEADSYRVTWNQTVTERHMIQMVYSSECA